MREKKHKDQNYDETNIQSIYEYARLLEGKVISEAIDLDHTENHKDKGLVGNALQERYFGVPRNSSPEPDFPLAPLELKSFGYWSSDKNDRADQRLALTDIDFMDFTTEVPFRNSHLYHKCHNMLMIAYLMQHDRARIDSEIKHVRLYEFEKVVASDMRQIERDYNLIVEKIMNGKASEISEADTEYLGAARTGNKESKKREAPKGDRALPRRFVFKQSYMTYLVREYIVPNRDFNIALPKSRLKNTIRIPQDKTFEEWLGAIDEKYIGKTAQRISKLKKIREIKGIIDFDKKNAFSELGYAMLGISSNSDVYLKKTNTVVKSVRVSESGIIAESSPFPCFRLLDVVAQEWPESDMFAYLSEQRFLLQIFVQKDKEYVYTGHVMLKFTPEELEKSVRPTWEMFKEKVKNGLRFEVKLDKNGKPIITNDIAGKVKGQIGLIKLHAGDITYDIASEHILGVSEEADKYIREHTVDGRFLRKPENRELYGDVLPNGDVITKQSFWLNKDYILQYIQERAPRLLTV